jgi:Skp family chaperone for outer membrane proteins
MFARRIAPLVIIGASLAIGLPANLLAADLKIIVIDQQSVFRDSLAGQDIARQGAILRDQILSEVQAEQSAIVNAQKDLAGNSQVYSPAQREQKLKALNARQNAYPMFEQRKQQVLQASLERASNQVESAFRPIVQQLIAENKATLVLDKGQLMYTAPGLDLTQEAIRRLNNVVKTVKVERVNLDAAPSQPSLQAPVSARATAPASQAPKPSTPARSTP